MKRVVVIGAGIGGLSAAVLLARAGVEVTVLEAHVYPGGCAGTFYHQGYRFEAGATLAGGFNPGGPMDILARASGISHWPGQPAEPAMVVHLPDGSQISRWGDERRWDVHRSAFGEKSLGFWRWQEEAAEALWDLALRLPAWPPQNFADLQNLTDKGIGWLGAMGTKRLKKLAWLAREALNPVAIHLRGMPESLRLFVDAQLLISAQATSRDANALYGAAALDLPRRGVLHVEGGMGQVAELLVQAVRGHGGQVLLREEATRIRLEGGRPVAVETRRANKYDADLVIANLTPWNVKGLLGDQAPRRLRHLPAKPSGQWGAFVVYLGVDGSVIPDGLALHHQRIVNRPLGEGNTIFLSLSPEWDGSRAPTGHRAITISTHTHLDNWWRLYEQDASAYKAKQTQFANELIKTAEQIIPGLRQAARLILPGTPVTFQRFTRRERGWVGGFPQTSIMQAWGPRIGPNLWMVGDSIFPGQSVAATALGGLRVAEVILGEQMMTVPEQSIQWRAV